MIRMLFAMFVTLAGFTAAALWMARGGDAREVVEELLPVQVRSELRAAVRRLDLEEVASRLPGAAPKADAPGDSNAAAAPGSAAAPETTAVPRAEEAPRAAEAPGAEDTPEPPAAPETQEIADETVEARDLPLRSEFALDLGGAGGGAAGDEDGAETTTALAASARSARDAAAPLPEPDQEAWASLIRRMLAVYQRTGAFE